MEVGAATDGWRGERLWRNERKRAQVRLCGGRRHCFVWDEHGKEIAWRSAWDATRGEARAWCEEQLSKEEKE